MTSRHSNSTTFSVRFLICFTACLTQAATAEDSEFLRSFVATHCSKCHWGKKAKAELDLVELAKKRDPLSNYATWERVVNVLHENTMPPDEEKQPTQKEKDAFKGWFETSIAKRIKARPGIHRPRRLSANEYRNTLRSVFGFDLEVAVIEAEQTIVEKSLVLKLLPNDPPGPSGFTNDTSANPLTTVIWDQYSYLVDAAIEELFSKKRKAELQKITNEIRNGKLTTEQNEAVIRHFLTRASRRPVQSPQVLDAVKRVESSDNKTVALKAEIKTALMSPAFMYRGVLSRPKAGRQVVDGYELAERLSYFLWADMPDDHLTSLAESGKLTQTSVLEQEIQRMLKSPKARSLTEVFAVQWLGLDDIDQVSNNPPYAVAMKSQPLDFMNYLFRDGRPILELIDSQTAFVSPLTAGFYPGDRGQMKPYRRPKGIEIEIVPNQKIKLNETKGRGGILTMPGILAMNKGPVIRGTWILERILGDPLPEPPPDVGQIPASPPGKKLTFRQRFEMHRNNPTCAVCHDRIDPLGFALQAYDQRGALREQRGPLRRRRKKNEPATPGSIDTSGKLPTGETFETFGELKQILVEKKGAQITKHVVERMMSYALARKLTVHDQPELRRIAAKLVQSKGSYHDLVREIALSMPFRETFVDEVDINKSQITNDKQIQNHKDQ